MTLSAQACYEHVRHALGGTSSLDRNAILNQTQRLLTTLHPWKWLDRTTTLGLTNGQSYINLPSDFNQLLAYGPYAGTTISLKLTSLQDIVEMRSANATDTGFGY